jgi:hypothetical protein
MVGRWKGLFSLSGICFLFPSVYFLGDFQLQFSVGNQKIYELHRGIYIYKVISLCRDRTLLLTERVEQEKVHLCEVSYSGF